MSSEKNPFDAVRAKSSINTKELRNVIYGSPENFQAFVEFQEKEEKHGLMPDPSYYEMSRYDQQDWNIRYTQKWREVLDVDIYQKRGPSTELIKPTYIIGGIGLMMNGACIDLMGTDAQRKKWYEKWSNGDIVTAYAQTEMGHGSDIQSLQTTATYDQTTQEWVINTPSLSAYKWWPGDLSVTSNWATVYAQVIVKGVRRGVFPLFCQIRDMETHKLLPGVIAGDIGPKWGYSMKDNGYLAFENVRYPKDSLFGKYVYVTDDGEWKTRGNTKVLYAAMMFVRECLLTMSSKSLAKATLIALRYANVRTQFKVSKTEERTIIDYQTQRQKIYPQIARSYASYFASVNIREIIAKNLANVQNNDYSLMKEVHLLLCGGKALYTQWSNEGQISLLQACGGHGYLISAGIAPMLMSSWPNAILEGENTVLLIQIARELLKGYQKAMVGETNGLKGTLKYLVNHDKYSNYVAPTEKSKYRLTETYLDMFASTTIRLIQKSAIKMQESMGNGMNGRDAFDKVGAISILEAAKMHSILFTLKFFVKVVSKLAEGPNKIALNRLALLFSVDMLHANSSQIIEAKCISAEGIGYTKELFDELLEEIHPDAFGLVEAWGYLDSQIGSTIGHSNGKPYENLLKSAKTYGQLNQFDVHPTMLEYIKTQKQIREGKGAAGPLPKL